MEFRNENIAGFDLAKYKIKSEKNELLSIPVIHSRVPQNESGVGFDIYNYDMLFNDEQVKKNIREGNTIGCFYIESPGMRSLLKKLSCDTFEMLTAASSVIRPGVAESGMMQEFMPAIKIRNVANIFCPKWKNILAKLMEL